MKVANFLCSFILVFFYKFMLVNADFPTDDDDFQWTSVSSTNGGTWAELLALLTLGNNQLQFTETVTYTIPSGSVGFYAANLAMSTASGVTVTFDMGENDGIVMYLNMGQNFYMNGDFVFKGSTSANADDNNGQMAMVVNGEYSSVNIEGVTIQDMNTGDGVILLNGDFTATLNSVTFNNIDGILAAAVYANGLGTLTLSSVTIEDCSVQSTGAMIYSTGYTVSGSVSESGNNGMTCMAIGGSCSVTSDTNLSKDAAKVAAIVVPIIIICCCAAGLGYYFSRLQKQKQNAVKKPLTTVVIQGNGQQNDGSIQTNYQQF